MDNKKAITQKDSVIKKIGSDIEILPLVLKKTMEIFSPQSQQGEAAKKIIKAASKSGATKVSMRLNSEAADTLGGEYEGVKIFKNNRSRTSTEVTVHFPHKGK